MIDGLIPRILQIDYKIIQHESVPLEQANLPDNEHLSHPEELPLVTIRQPKSRVSTSKKQQRAEASVAVANRFYCAGLHGTAESSRGRVESG